MLSAAVDASSLPRYTDDGPQAADREARCVQPAEHRHHVRGRPAVHHQRAGVGAAVEAPVGEANRSQVGRTDRAAGAVREAQLLPAHGHDLRGKAAAAWLRRPSARGEHDRDDDPHVGSAYSGRDAARHVPRRALAAACPSTSRTRSARPRASQLITVEADDAARRTRRCAPGAAPARAGWPRAGLTRLGSAGTGSPPTAARVTARRRPGHSGSTPRCTATSQTPESGSATAGCAAATGGTRIRPRPPTTPSSTSPAAGARRSRSSEGIWQNPRAYPFLAVIEFNTHPAVPGRGSGIFLHAQTGRPTNGCVSLRRDQLAAVLRWLRPSANPVIWIGTK